MSRKGMCKCPKMPDKEYIKYLKAEIEMWRRKLKEHETMEKS